MVEGPLIRGPKAGGGREWRQAKARPAKGELVAVIAAAVAAASGMEPEGFRIVGIRGSSGARGSAEDVSPFAQRGLNTPAWGHEIGSFEENNCEEL